MVQPAAFHQICEAAPACSRACPALTHALPAPQSKGKEPRPSRKGFGKAGKALKVKVNHYAVACALRSAWHYDVTFSAVRLLCGIYVGCSCFCCPALVPWLPVPAGPR